jgi:two-component system osmolarity sensor histidine kinase EnvZ
MATGGKVAGTIALVARAAAQAFGRLTGAFDASSRASRRALRTTHGPMRWLSRFLPRSLYGRSLVIVIAPVVLLQSVVAYVFMERHWQLVTRRLSAAVTADISAIIDVYRSFPQDRGSETLQRIAQERLNLDIDFLRNARLPPSGPRPFFSLLDQALSSQLELQIKEPFWLDTVGQSDFVEIRVQLDNDVLRVVARRSAAYASNSHIFLAWMLGTSLVLLTVAILFLRNQIRPILALADAAESFGKGRDVEFRPSGATEVRQAGHAFLEMKRRVERTLSERTTMLNGVSHDLRTILTRFKLSLALLDRTPEIEAIEKDVDEMTRMLEAYLAFVRGEAGELPLATDIRALLEELKLDAERQGHQTELSVIGDPVVVVRPDAIRRVLTNLVSNAARHGDRIAITATHDARYLIVTVDDDGPGIPPQNREEVFKPFVRLDEARNVDEGGSGLGLSISRDIARSHGGDIALLDSPIGGLRAMMRLPV